MRRAIGIVIATMVIGVAKTPARRTSEVTPIKHNKTGPRAVQGNQLAFLPGGRFTATDVTLVDLIVQAYPTRRIQMRGGPDWIDADRFDIVAKADAADGEVTREQWPLMMQAL